MHSAWLLNSTVGTAHGWQSICRKSCYRSRFTSVKFLLEFDFEREETHLDGWYWPWKQWLCGGSGFLVFPTNGNSIVWINSNLCGSVGGGKSNIGTGNLSADARMGQLLQQYCATDPYNFWDGTQSDYLAGLLGLDELCGSRGSRYSLFGCIPLVALVDDFARRRYWCWAEQGERKAEAPTILVEGTETSHLKEGMPIHLYIE